ncbi:MAG: hypothetical protein K2M19_06025 [Muribaculaceae bacterium]|nr:hypothetical protein [Muribaculaceae bacterium]
MIWRLLRRNVSVAQLAAYALAAFVGLAVILTGVQFYSDALAATGGKSPASLPEGRLIVSKRVGLSATLRGEAPSFTPGDIESLEAQPWCRGVAEFTASDFGVHASVELGGRVLQTALFFESLPDSLMSAEVRGSGEWEFHPESPFVPVVLPRDYLALYNFGFAASGKMPPLSEGMISSVPLAVTLTGNGLRETLPARIVGFSDGLNTIAVPQAFMSWASGRYGRGDSVSAPSRLIVTVEDPGSPAVTRYMESRGYEIAAPAADDGAGRVVRTLAGVVTGVGGTVMILAVVILVLSLFLLVQKSRSAISGLLLLGYTPGAISRGLVLMSVGVTLGATAAAFAGMLAARSMWVGTLEAESLVSSFPVAGFVAASVLLAAVCLLDAAVIYIKVRGCFRS